MTAIQTNNFLLKQLDALIADEPNLLANLSNASALLKEHLSTINWVGFYLYEKETDQLVLGPFQGKVACVRIDIGKGVCGTAFQKKESILVPDVLEFPGHIFCFASSQSELVIPLISDSGLMGVLDIDAPIKNRFTEADRILMEEFCAILMNSTKNSNKEIDFYTN